MTSSRDVAEPASSVAGQRRAPVQQRSSLRLDQILGAAAALVDEMAFDDVTTGEIAKRAGVSIGSVYRFFDDKPAIYRALSVRHFEAYLALLASALADEDLGTSQHWERLIEITIDCYVDMLRHTPGFRGFGDDIDVYVLDTDRDNDTVLADKILELLSTELRIANSGPLRLPLLIAVTASDSLLSLAFRRDTHGDPAVIAEAKSVVRNYLSPHFERALPRRTSKGNR